MTNANKTLYYYSNMRGLEGWYPSIDAFRKATGATWAVRTAHHDIDPPAGYTKTGNLAFTGATRIPTARDLVRSLTT